MTPLTDGEIQRQLVAMFPELRPAAERYWTVGGGPGSDSGPHVVFDATVTVLLAMPAPPRRDHILRGAVNVVETMLSQDDDAVPNLAFIGLLESRGAWWWRRALPFLGPAAQGRLDRSERWGREESAASTAADVEHGLYVADASIIPTALGNNPLLTIAALAERSADLLVTDPGHSALVEPPRARHDPPVQSM